MRPVEAFDLLTRDGFRPVLLGLPTAKSDGNLGYRVAAQEPTGGTETQADARVSLALDTALLSFGGPLEGPPVARPGTPAPDVIGTELERAMHEVTRRGLIAVVFQPRTPVESLAVAEQQPSPGVPVEAFREVALWLDESQP